MKHTFITFFYLTPIFPYLTSIVLTSTLITSLFLIVFSLPTHAETVIHITDSVTSSRVEQSYEDLADIDHCLSSEDIEQSGYHQVSDILRTLGGAGVSNTGGMGKASSLRIRGEEGYRTLVLIDGVDVSDPTATQVSPNIEHIMLDAVDRIEILRGPQGFIYGADAGGVVNILSPKGQDSLRTTITMEAGTMIPVEPI